MIYYILGCRQRRSTQIYAGAVGKYHSLMIETLLGHSSTQTTSQGIHSVPHEFGMLFCEHRKHRLEFDDSLILNQFCENTVAPNNSSSNSSTMGIGYLYGIVA